ncbi:MAG: amidohydrolase family protein [Promethearchaeota archaeon]|jgi:predicted TIM-barrel fold metal-dependent hydrolase
MIVDIHTHLPKYKKRAEDEVENQDREKESRFNIRRSRAIGPISDEGRSSWEDHYNAMDPVDKAIIFGVARYGDEIDVNTPIAEYVQQDPNKLIGFFSVDPRDPECIEKMRYYVDEIGFKGLKTGPVYQGYHPNSYKATKVFKEAERLGIPVLFHQATAPGEMYLLELAQPLLLEKVAHQFPELKIVYAHIGHPWWREVIMLIRRNENMYADLSGNFYHPWDFYNSLVLAYEWGQLDKLLFGSDFPLTTPKETINGLRDLNNMLEGTRLPRIPEDDIENIINRDSLKILGIE